MSKVGSHDPFEYLKHNLWPKEGPGVKMPIWLPTTKSQESPWFIYVQVAWHLSLESCQQGLQLCFRPPFNWNLHKKLWASKVIRVPISRISKLSIWEFETKWQFGATPMAKYKAYYKGEASGFPQVLIVVNLMNLCMPMAHSCTKSVLIPH